MEHIAPQTIKAETSGEFNDRISSHESLLDHDKGMTQACIESSSMPSASDTRQPARMATAAFGEIVALLSFSPVFKHLSLADLEWLVPPALATQQVTVVRGKLKDHNGLLVPIGVALWAHVSEEVDHKLEA